jgi:hypothetical protein
MPQELACRCTLCDIEARLVSELALIDQQTVRDMFSSHSSLLSHPSIPSLLSHLRNLRSHDESDSLLRGLLALRVKHSSLGEPLLVLAFLPLLHRTVHLVTNQQFALSPEDTAQQALSFFLEFMCSSDLRNRSSHIAYAVAREVKRHVFTWAERESRTIAVLDELSGEIPAPSSEHYSLERLTELRHFLRRCVSNGVLTDAEMHSLVEFKLNGGNAWELGAFDGISPNAVRQKLKRLLARLRRIAQHSRSARLSSVP